MILYILSRKKKLPKNKNLQQLSNQEKKRIKNQYKNNFWIINFLIGGTLLILGIVFKFHF